jgi:SprA-related family
MISPLSNRHTTLILPVDNRQVASGEPSKESKNPISPEDKKDKTARETTQFDKSQKLDPKELRYLQSLKQTDRAVRAHEAAHLAAAGALARGGANFSYQTGPDGQRYAVSGDVQVDMSSVQGDPQATLAKGEQIRRAALAPAQPSGQDIAVAANAARMSAEARIELLQQKPSSEMGDQESQHAIRSYQEVAYGYDKHRLDTHA